MKPTEKQIQDIVGQVTELTWSYGIWWSLVTRANSSKIKPGIDKYPNFISAIVASTLQGSVIILCRLFDTDPTVLSIRSLVKQLRTTNPQKAQELVRLIGQHRKSLEKIKLLRNKVYAHRDGKVTPIDIFEVAKLTPTDMRKLLLLTHDITAALSNIEGTNSEVKIREQFQACERDVMEEAQLIMDDIRRAHR